MTYQTLGLVFFTALLLSLFVVPFTVALAHRVGAVDVPKQRSSHTQPITRLGGLGIAVSLLVSCLMFLPMQPFTWAFLSGALIIVLIGLIDDIADIGPRWKFLGQIVAATVFILAGGGLVSELGDLFGWGTIILSPPVAMLFTLVFMVGGINAVNLSDGLDGLAGGMALIALMVFTFFSWHLGAPELQILCTALFGATLGFLRYNSYPARLFMGDVGSLLLGYVMMAVVIGGSRHGGSEVPLVSWAMVITLPLLDTLLVMTRRMLHGCSPFQPDRSHLHHRLMQFGLPHASVVGVMYGLMALFGAAAVLLHTAPDWLQFAVLLLLGLIVFGSVELLLQRGFTLTQRGRKHVSFKAWRHPLLRRTVSLVYDSVRWMGGALVVALSLPAFFLPMPDLSRNEVLVLLLLAGVIMFYGLQNNPAARGMLHGAVYFAFFLIIFLYNLIPSGSGIDHYLSALSILAALWLAMKFALRRRVVLRPSSFEFLLLLFSWFLPFVLFEELNFAPEIIAAGRSACLQALPLLLTVKLYFNVRPRGSHTVIGLLSGTIVLLALRGI